MGTYVNDSTKKVSLGSSYNLGQAMKEIAGLLGVGTRSDGRYYLADICQAGSINRFAKYKPFAYNAYNFSSDSARDTARNSDAVNNGFGKTPTITPLSGSIPHAVYTYTKPSGAATAPNRIRDFDGYNHNAGSPLQIEWPTGNKITKEQVNSVIIYVNYQTNGWDSTTCVGLGDILDDSSRDYYFALLITNGSTAWILPTTTKIKDTIDKTYVTIPVLFAANSSLLASVGDGMNKTVLSALSSATTSQTYTIAVVGTSMEYTGTARTELPIVKSLEFISGMDRASLSINSLQSLSGINGSVVTPAWNYTCSSDSVGSSMSMKAYVIKNNISATISTTSAWTRSNVYIVMRINNMTGFIYKNGAMVANTGQIDIGTTVTIGASASKTEVIANGSTLDDYVFYSPDTANYMQLKIELIAYQSSSLAGESVSLGSANFTLAEK